MVRFSIIIPTYNEEKYIKKTLESIKKQDYKDVEVIVADSNSKDKTLAIARKAYKGVKIHVEKRRGVPLACNKSAKVAKGEILLFIDADTSITGTLLKAYDEAFKGSGVVAATGPIVPLEKTSKKISIGFKVISVYLVKFFIKIGQPSTISSNLAISRKAYLKIGGFDESLATFYDWDISNRLSKIGKIIFVNGAIAKTSVRRVEKWGMFKYFTYHLGNNIRYHLYHTAKNDYEPIR